MPGSTSLDRSDHSPCSRAMSMMQGMQGPHQTVGTLARLAQWKIESLTPNMCFKSSVFRMGSWNWRLQIKKCGPLHVWLFREQDPSSNDYVPVVTFVLRVLNGGHRQISASPVTEKAYQNHMSEYFAWSVETAIQGKFVIEAEFLDMKINIENGDAIPFFCAEKTIQPQSHLGVLNCLNRMLEDELHTDVTIKTPTGVTKAHLAILASRSPVFQVMFEHDLKERKTCTIEIEDMTLEDLKALLSYLYGSIKHDMFQKHRIALLQASDKYDIKDLKDVCEESLLEDISQENVLERLHDAWMYHLSRLKSECLRYLFDFGKVYDVQKEFNQFLLSADKELIIEMFQEGLSTWR